MCIRNKCPICIASSNIHFNSYYIQNGNRFLYETNRHAIQAFTNIISGKVQKKTATTSIEIKIKPTKRREKK